MGLSNGSNGWLMMLVVSQYPLVKWIMLCECSAHRVGWWLIKAYNQVLLHWIRMRFTQRPAALSSAAQTSDHLEGTSLMDSPTDS